MWKKYVRRNSVKKIIIIPAYNEEENIERTVNAIQKSAQGFDYVIINASPLFKQLFSFH